MATPEKMWDALKDVNNEAQRLVGDLEEARRERRSEAHLRTMAEDELKRVRDHAARLTERLKNTESVLKDVRAAAGLEEGDGVSLSRHVAYLKDVAGWRVGPLTGRHVKPNPLLSAEVRCVNVESPFGAASYGQVKFVVIGARYAASRVDIKTTLEEAEALADAMGGGKKLKLQLVEEAP